MREAIRSKTDCAAARYNLAVILASHGDREAALAQLDVALQVELLFKEARSLMDRLREPQ